MIVDLKGKIPRHPALDTEVVLINVGAVDIRIFRIDAQQTAGRRSGTLFAEVGDQRHGLVEANCPREFARLSHIGRLVRGQRVRSIQSHIGRYIVEDLVISHTEAKANHCVVMAKQGLGESRCIRQAQNRREVRFVGIHTGIAHGERRLREHERSDSALCRIDL